MAKIFRTNILSLSGYNISINPADSTGFLRHDGNWDGTVVTDSDTGVFASTGWVNSNYYPRTNPSGYIRNTETGSFITTGQTGVFSNADTLDTYHASSFVLTSTTGNFATTGWTNSNYYPRTNPSGYVSSTETGSFVTTGQTGSYANADTLDGYHATSFALAANTGGFITTGDGIYTVGNILTRPSSDFAYFPNIANYYSFGSKTGAFVFNTPISRNSYWMFKLRLHGYAYHVAKVIDFSVIGYAYGASPYFGNIDGQSGAVVFYDLVDNGDDGYTKSVGLNRSGNVAIAIGDTGLSSSYWNMTADAWVSRVTKSLPSTGWNITVETGSNFDWGDIHPLFDNRTGGFLTTGSAWATYYPRTNPSGYVQSTETGSFSTTGWVDSSYYPRSNPSGYVRTVETGVYSNADTLDGYHASSFALVANTGSFITTSQTGVFANTGWVNTNYYPRANPSGYVRNTETGSFVTTGQTGVYSNADTVDGYHASSFAMAANTGSFLTTGVADSRYVNVTGDESISGEKYFNDYIGIKTTNPLQALQVSGNIVLGNISSASSLNNAYFVHSYGDGGWGPYNYGATLWNNGGLWRHLTFVPNGADIAFGTHVGGVVPTGSNAFTEVFTIKNDGKVGFGTISPTASYEVTGRTAKYSNGGRIYRWRMGGSTDTNWKTVATVNLPSSTWSAVGWEVNALHHNNNIGSTSSVYKYTYYVSAVRSLSAIDDTNTATVAGPTTNHVRAVKTATGVFELQLRTPSIWNVMDFEVKELAGNTTNIVYIDSPSDGDTGIATYNAVSNNAIEYFSRSIINGWLTVSGQLTSQVAAGTAPFVIASTTAVTNLNADLLDGYHSSEFETTSHAVLTYAQKSETGNFITSSQTGVFTNTGWVNTNYYPRTNPSGYVMTSQTGVYSNADTVDGYHASSFALAANTGSFVTTSQTGVFSNADTLDTYHAVYFVNTGTSQTIGGTKNFNGTLQYGGETVATQSYVTSQGYLDAAVTSLNSKQGAVTIEAGSGVSVDNGTAGKIIINSTGGGSTNADTLDGYHASSFALAANTGNFVTTSQTGVYSNADTLDTYHATYFVTTGTSQTIGGTKNFNGTLQYGGATVATQTYVTSQGYLSAAVTSLNSKQGSLTIEAGTNIEVDSDTAGKIIINATGSSSSDADTLDGQHGSYYRNYANMTGTFDDGVVSLNSKQGAVTLVGGTNVTIDDSSTAGTISISSNQTNVANLNGQPASYYLNYANMTGSISTANQITSTLSAGTAPFVVASNTVVSNLNADKLDGYDATSFALTANTGNFLTSSTAVTSVNSKQGAVTIAAGTNITVDNTTAGTVKINCSYAGVTSIQGISGDVTIRGTNGILVSTSGSEILIDYSSDRRVKRNIKKLKDAIKIIEKLPIKTWEFNGRGCTKAGDPGVGVIAQDIINIAPNFVGTRRGKLDPDGPIVDIYNINVPNMLGTLIGAVQELLVENNKLSSRVTILEEKCKKFLS